MATPPEVTSKIDAILRAIAAEVADLPTRIGEWEEETDDNRMAFSLEWKELMDRLSLVGSASRNGTLTAQQQATYRDLLHRLDQALPLIDRLKLSRPRALRGT